MVVNTQYVIIFYGMIIVKYSENSLILKTLRNSLKIYVSFVKKIEFQKVYLVL